MTKLYLLLSQLKDNQSLKITPQGTSMCPCFLGGRDSVYVARPNFPLHKGDIALFLRSNGVYIIHRVYKVEHSKQGNLYYMLGDNQGWIEGPISEDQIHAVAVKIIRKGKTIHCQTNHLYRAFVRIWLLVRPLRLGLLNPYRKLKALFHKEN